MSAHETPPPSRVLRADRCPCSELPQVNHDERRGATWFSCTCGRISQESQSMGKAIDNWNELVWRGPC